MKTPHTYVIIFGVVLLAWLLTFLVPAGKFSTQEIEYTDANGDISTRTVLMQDSFRYAYPLDNEYVYQQLNQLEDDPQELEELDVDPEALAAVLAEGPKELSQSQLDEVGLTDDTLYSLHGEKIYDTSEKLHKTAKVWGTDDFGGFGFIISFLKGWFLATNTAQQ